MPQNIEKKDQKPKKSSKKRGLARESSLFTDGELLNKSRVWANLLEQYLPQFQALDPLFDLSYITAWRSALDACDSLYKIHRLVASPA